MEKLKILNMSCQKCSSNRIVSIGAKCADCFNASIESNDYDGYVPDDLGCGSGDYISMEYCLECGQIQGEWPLPISELEQADYDEDDEDDEDDSTDTIIW